MKKTENELIKENLILKDEILFLITDLIHEEENLKKLSNDDLLDIGKIFRMFTFYSNKSILNENELNELNLLKPILKDKMWIKVYGDTYDNLSCRFK